MNMEWPNNQPEQEKQLSIAEQFAECIVTSPDPAMQEHLNLTHQEVLDAFTESSQAKRTWETVMRAADRYLETLWQVVRSLEGQEDQALGTVKVDVSMAEIWYQRDEFQKASSTLWDAYEHLGHLTYARPDVEAYESYDKNLLALIKDIEVKMDEETP